MDLDAIRNRAKYIKDRFSSWEYIIPGGVQLFVFYAPLKKVDAPDLCGIIFPERDYTKVRERMVMWNLNGVDTARQYVGVSIDFPKPFSVLEYGLLNLDKSPQKIMWDGSEFYLTSEPLLSNPFGMTYFTVTMIEMDGALHEMVGAMKEITKVLSSDELREYLTKDF
ncbi:MAG: hypothetical protein J7K73_02270 [Nanoarchaeota archaeon]|nr:hypothetical protein [Nanoarchaeota archaeon]